ncbi:MAG TPA: hypothetical protein EYN73_09860 [Chromatiaceae bacterium]|jgi:hypothetical protein|nr:hypothetical protein [Chromatiaceae bacterium]HIA09349.1 hypothetical protein [Chromatiaceae bacterium]HIB83277.1 hypothetical protein [Chromatiaceae bacterium]
MKNIRFTSTLDRHHRENLEHMLFFNRQQASVQQGIKACIGKYGVPEVCDDGGHLRIRLEKYDVVQSLYVIERRYRSEALIGVIVYVRDRPSTITILHLAIAEGYQAHTGRMACGAMTWGMIARVRNIASQIRGVRRVRFAYGAPADASLKTVPKPSAIPAQSTATAALGRSLNVPETLAKTLH